MDTYTPAFVDFANKIGFKELPDPAITIIKHLFLDSIGCALAALDTDKGRMNLELANRLGGPTESSIIGTDKKVSYSTASLVNGELIGTIDYDALMPGAHNPPYIIPPVLAIAEHIKASGKELILASAIGFEISGRIARALAKPNSGFEGKKGETFSWGDRAGQAYSNPGVAMGAGRLLKLNREQLSHAFGISAHLSQVLTHARFTFSENRYLNKYGIPGWQNTGGIMAVLLSEMGYTGDLTPLDDQEGLWKFCGYGGWNPDKLLENLGTEWVFNNVRFKPYPCCLMLHGAVNCIHLIIEENGISPKEIEKIDAYCHPTVEQPCFINPDINNIVDAQFNPRYVLAVAAHGIKFGIEWQDEATMKNPDIIGLGDKISFQGHPRFAEERLKDPNSFLAKVILTTKDKAYTKEILHPKGTPHSEFQMTEVDLIEKFRHNASRALTAEKTEKAIAFLLDLEKQSDTSELFQYIA